MQTVFSPNKQRSFEPFVCLDQIYTISTNTDWDIKQNTNSEQILKGMSLDIALVYIQKSIYVFRFAGIADPSV